MTHELDSMQDYEDRCYYEWIEEVSDSLGIAPPTTINKDKNKAIAYSVLVDYCRAVGGREANIVGFFDWLEDR